MDFKDKVKVRRIELGLTLQEIAKIVKVSTPTIQRYESGEIKNVRRDKIKLLSDALQVSPSYLMGWDEPEEGFDTIAAHHEGDEWTEEELEEIERFKEFVRAKRHEHPTKGE